MASKNFVLLIGNLTRDAETRTAGSATVIKFGLATSERFKDRNGEVRENTEFHTVEYWGSEKVAAYLKKGTSVCVTGSIRTDSWTAQDGTERRATVIRALDLQLLGSPKERTAAPAPAAPQDPDDAPDNPEDDLPF